MVPCAIPSSQPLPGWRHCSIFSLEWFLQDGKKFRFNVNKGCARKCNSLYSPQMWALRGNGVGLPLDGAGFSTRLEPHLLDPKDGIIVLRADPPGTRGCRIALRLRWCIAPQHHPWHLERNHAMGQQRSGSSWRVGCKVVRAVNSQPRAWQV